MPIFDSQYPVNSNPAGEDKILTTDTSDSSAIKSVTLTKVQEWLGSISKWVTSGMIADQAVTADKIADEAVTPAKLGGLVEGLEIQTGTVSITPASAGTTTFVTVNFSTEFSAPPRVVATPHSGYAGLLMAVVNNTTTTSVDIGVNRANTTETIVRWIAIGRRG